ncbi:unnamed protein product [Caenorhabditis nigoni]
MIIQSGSYTKSRSTIPLFQKGMPLEKERNEITNRTQKKKCEIRPTTKLQNIGIGGLQEVGFRRTGFLPHPAKTIIQSMIQNSSSCIADGRKSAVRDVLKSAQFRIQPSRLQRSPRPQASVIYDQPGLYQNLP